MVQYLWTKLIEAPRVVVEYGITSFFDNVQYFVAGLGILVGAVVLAAVWILIAERWTHARSIRRWKYDSSALIKFKETVTMRSQNIIRLVAMTLAILSLVFGIGLAAAAAGFNAWTIFVAYGMLTAIVSIGFGTIIKNAVAFFILAYTDKVEEGWVITVGKFTGVLTAIHILWIEMKLLNDIEQGKRMPSEIHIPTWQVIDTQIVRNFEAEVRYRETLSRDQNRRARQKWEPNKVA